MTRYEEIKLQLLAEPRAWLVTGCAGFIGSHLVESLLALGQRVTGLDNFVTGKQENLNDVRAKLTAAQWAGFRLIEGDICSKDDCERAVENISYVLHQGGLGSVPRSISDPVATHSTNVTGFLNMLDAARRAQCVKGFVYASSSSVYGDHPALPKIEENIGKPLSPYALSKSIDEQYASVFSRTFGFHSIGLRYFNVFGPRQDPEGPYAAVIPRWISAMINGSAVEIYGDGDTSRDFCFIENVVQANLLSALSISSLAESEALNVAVGGRTTLKQLFALLQEGLSQRVEGFERQEPVYLRFRPGDVRHSEADLGRIKARLGYDPSHTVEEGLEEAFDWYVANAQRAQPK